MKYVWMIAATVSLVACNSFSPTEPTETSEPVAVAQQAEGTVTAPQTTAPTPADQSAPAPYTELSNVDGSGKVCNPMAHVVTFRVERYDINGSPTSLAGQILLDTELITVQPGQCAPVKGVGFLASEIKCGSIINIQVDVAVLDGSHLGAAIVKNFEAEPCCEEESETEITYEYGEWSECAPVVQSSNGSPEPKCSRSRTVTTVYTTTYKCSKEVEVRKETSTESEPCECISSCPASKAESRAAQGFELKNSGEATETEWVNENVFPGPYELYKKNEHGYGPCWFSEYNAPVVLIKAGTKYKYYLNVTKFQLLCSYDFKGISHATYFRCD